MDIVRRNLLLVLGILVGILLVVSSTKRLFTFRTTTQKVEEAQARLEALREENKKLKEQKEYTKSDEFREREIRDKLGLAKEGEAVVVIPNNERDQQQEKSNKQETPNYIKWWSLFFGS